MELMPLREFKMYIFVVCIKNGLDKECFNKLIKYIISWRMRLI